MPSGVWGPAWDESPDGMVVLSADWQVLYVNQVGAGLLGHTPEQVHGVQLWEHLPWLVGTSSETTLRSIASTGEPATWESHHPGLGWFEARGHLVGDRLVAVFRNVDDRKAADAEREVVLGRAGLLLELAQALTAADSVVDVASSVVRMAAARLECAFAGLSLVQGPMLHTVALGQLDAEVEDAWQVLPMSHVGPATHVARSGEPMYHDTFQSLAEQFPHVTGQYHAAGLRALVSVPLQLRGGSPFGSLNLAWSDDHPTDQAERDTIAAAAAMTALAVRRAQLADERRQVAQALQESMLTALPEHDRLHLQARYVPAARGELVGGDWYDAVVQPDGAAALVIGDVSGHDITAAGTMGQLRAMLRAFAWDACEPPSSLLTRLDRGVHGLRIDTLATLVLARIVPDPGGPHADGAMLHWSSAGHPPPVVLTRAGRALVLDTPPDLLVGLDVGAARTDHRHPLAPGDVVILYTDGLIERRGRSLDEGIAELLAVLGRHAGQDLGVVLDALVAELVPADAQDDCAFLAARWDASEVRHLHSTVQSANHGAGTRHR